MRVSIITVNYNDKLGLEKTIESVVSQDFSDYEYIVIDGGSSDGSLEVIKRHSEYISHWVSEADSGIYNAMNKALEFARGEYCIFMNSGDTFVSPQTLNKIFKEYPKEDIICGVTCTAVKIIVPPEEITLDFLFNNTICHQCAFIKTTLMKKYRYDENYKIVADRKFFLQALVFENCSYKAVNVNVVNYDILGFSAMNPLQSRMEYDKVLEEMLPQRIRMDYGARNQGQLYGDTWYDKLFVEIRRRNYRKLVYAITVVVMYCISLFKRSARFIKEYPRLLQD